MKAKTLQILWHDKLPVFAVDFHPSEGYLATAGADKEIKARQFQKPAVPMASDTPQNMNLTVYDVMVLADMGAGVR